MNVLIPPHLPQTRLSATSWYLTDLKQYQMPPLVCDDATYSPQTIPQKSLSFWRHSKDMQ